MLFPYFRQNADRCCAGKEELKVGGGSISMIVDVFSMDQIPNGISIKKELNRVSSVFQGCFQGV